VQELKKQGRVVQVLEDNAPAQICHFDNDYMKLSDMKKLLWLPNSSDGNAIEQAWPWLRRHFTKDYLPSPTAEECEKQ
jgi:hypothetical protein